jgi:hypothetical protein
MGGQFIVYSFNGQLGRCCSPVNFDKVSAAGSSIVGQLKARGLFPCSLPAFGCSETNS